MMRINIHSLASTSTLLLFTAIAVACNSETASKPLDSVLPTVSNTPIVIETAQSETPATMGYVTVEAPTDVFASADQFGDGYVARIPIEEVEGTNPDEILRLLLNQWLDHYRTNCTDVDFKLEDYAIESVVQLDAKYRRYEMIASTIYTIRSSYPPTPDWDAGCAEIQANGWTRRCDTFGYFRDGPYFRLRLMVGWGT
jgi:hypothetical protein